MLKQVFTSGYAGLRGWLLQRLTAIVMATYVGLLAVLVTQQPPVTSVIWQALFQPIWMRLATMLFLFSLLLHAWLGMRDILKDYVQAEKLRCILQWVVIALLMAYAIWTIVIFRIGDSL